MSTEDHIISESFEESAHTERMKKKTWRMASLLGGLTLFVAVLASRSFDLVMMFQDILQPYLGGETGKVVFGISIFFTLLIISLPLLGGVFIRVFLKAIAASHLGQTTIVTRYVETTPLTHAPSALEDPHNSQDIA